MTEKTNTNIGSVTHNDKYVNFTLKKIRYFKLVSDKAFIYKSRCVLSGFDIKREHYHSGDIVTVGAMRYYKYNWFQRLFYGDACPSKIYLHVSGMDSFILIHQNKNDWVEATREEYETYNNKVCHGDRCQIIDKSLISLLR